MSEESEAAVRRVLDAMENTHRRVVAVGWSTVVITLGAYAWLAYVDRTTGTDVRRLLMAAVLALTCLTAWATFALAVIVLRSSRRILRAIELSAARRVDMP